MRLQRYKEFVEQGGMADDLPAYNENLYQKTGWYRGEDGKPRFWINDADATVRIKTFTDSAVLEDAAKTAKRTGAAEWVEYDVRLSDVLDHPELYELYPEVANVRTKIIIRANPDGTLQFKNFAQDPGNFGSTIGGETLVKRIEIGNPLEPDQLRETLIHEAQHVIQQIEGFAAGTSARTLEQVAGDLGHNVVLHEAAKLVRGGMDNVDEIGDALELAGFPAKTVKEVLDIKTGRNFHLYLNAELTDDTLDATNLWTEINMARHKSEADAVLILDYLAKGGSDVGETTRMLNALEAAIDEKSLRGLGYQAYLHAAGEAEARIAGRLSRFKDGEPTMRMVDPRSDPALRQGLSQGPLGQPGAVTVMPGPEGVRIENVSVRARAHQRRQARATVPTETQ